MDSLIMFCIGLTTAIVLLPIMQTICELICTVFELFKSYLSVKIIQNNAEIQKINDSLTPESTHAVGFEIPSEEYCDDDEEDHYHTKSHKIGFEVTNG